MPVAASGSSNSTVAAYSGAPHTPVEIVVLRFERSEEAASKLKEKKAV